jgi:septum formation protein
MERLTTSPAPMVLASASPRRRELLAAMGVPFTVDASPLNEPAERPSAVTPRQWAEAVAYYKARSVAELHPGAWVLGADTLVSCAGLVLGKPADLADARRMLELQARLPGDVITGVALVRCAMNADPSIVAGAERLLFSDVSRVWMRDDEHLRSEYLLGGDWQGKAGAYGIQNVGDRLVERLEGSFSNVVGLPVERLQTILSRLLR